MSEDTTDVMPDDDDPDDCPACGGTGHCQECEGEVKDPPCPTCGNAGDCLECDGSGWA